MVIQQIINGLALGMGYALIAVGYSLVFGILRLVNFSHGAIYAFGAHPKDSHPKSYEYFFPRGSWG